MIEVKEAVNLILENSKQLDAVDLPLQHVLGYVLAEDVAARIDYPPFNQSAMDGYAIFSIQKEYKLIGEIQAGDKIHARGADNEAYMIFTGAAVPEGALAVVPVEQSSEQNGTVSFTASIKENQHIRPSASIIKKGETVLAAGNTLNPAAIGFLASQGIAKVKVIPKPKVSLIITGNELLQASEDLSGGFIYESNSAMLSAVLQENRLQAEKTLFANDNFNHLQEQIEKALPVSDVLIFSGGVSAGKYDLVQESLVQAGFQTVFHKVNQKPGKPLLFCRNGQKLAFGLPGNPASALVCFYRYVLPALLKMQGREAALNTTQMEIAHPFSRKADGKTLFLRAMAKDGKVEVFPDQNSNSLRSFAIANALVVLPGDVNDLGAGQMVEVVMVNGEKNQV